HRAVAAAQEPRHVANLGGHHPGHAQLDPAATHQRRQRRRGVATADVGDLAQRIELQGVGGLGGHAASNLGTSRMKTGRPVPKMVTPESPGTRSSGRDNALSTTSSCPSSRSTSSATLPESPSITTYGRSPMRAGAGTANSSDRVYTGN